MLQEKDLVTINRNLVEMQQIGEELIRAARAKVPDIAVLQAKCDECRKRYELLKDTYFREKL